MRPHDRQRLYEDTPLEFEEKLLELWRATTIERRLAELCSIGASVNELARAALRTRYPDASRARSTSAWFPAVWIGRR